MLSKKKKKKIIITIGGEWLEVVGTFWSAGNVLFLDLSVSLYIYLVFEN